MFHLCPSLGLADGLVGETADDELASVLALCPFLELMGRRRRKQVSLNGKVPDMGILCMDVGGGGVHAEALCVLRKERTGNQRNFHCKNRKVNPSTTVQKSVQLAMQNRGQGTRPYPHTELWNWTLYSDQADSECIIEADPK